MRKFFAFFLLSLLLVIAGCRSSSTTASTSTTSTMTTTTTQTTSTLPNVPGPKLVIHYHRIDGNYANWNLWLWQYEPTSKSGQEFDFNGDDSYGKVAVVSLNDPALTGATSVGIIVREGAWVQKDIESDRYIDVSNLDSNDSVTVWLLQGDPVIYKNMDDVYTGPQVTSAAFVDLQTIQISTSAEITDPSKVQVYQDGNPIPTDNVEINRTNNGAQIALKSDMSFTSNYVIKIDGFKDKQVDISQLFNTDAFNAVFAYSGNDLGATYTSTGTSFRVWAPFASAMKLNLYTSGDKANNDLIQSYDMSKDVKGTWVKTLSGDLKNKYYTYTVTNYGVTSEVVDPYAKAVGVNGQRGMIVDLDATDPEGWTTTARPPFTNYTDAIIYELQLRDLSESDSSGITNKGKYLGLTETGTTDPNITDKVIPTGLDHIKDLGVTHVHLLPTFDFQSVDEKSDTNQYNWGYDPLNYNAPEGSYSTNPYDGNVRIEEYKEMVEALHQNGLRLVVDVVYNHTGPSQNSNLNLLVPNYYYRTDGKGKFLNGSGCGNETASERYMMRKFIIDSVVYWADEYKVDGFRFDLMGLTDIDTMNAVRSELNKIDPSILVYGEGWTGGSSGLAAGDSALTANVNSLNGIAVFNDLTRDGIKGSVFNGTQGGFIQLGTNVSNVKLGITATAFGAHDPASIVNYVAAHDNNTLWDKISLTEPNASEETKILMDKQAAAIVFTSQGIPFMQAGQEFLRTKYDSATGTYNSNSYNAPDYVNALDWDRLNQYSDVNAYYQGLIALRKAHPAFRMTSSADITANLAFFSTPSKTIGYTISNNANDDSWGTIVVLFNSTGTATDITLPESGSWNIVADENTAGVSTIRTVEGDSITVAAHGTIVAYLNK